MAGGDQNNQNPLCQQPKPLQKAYVRLPANNFGSHRVWRCQIIMTYIHTSYNWIFTPNVGYWGGKDCRQSVWYSLQRQARPTHFHSFLSKQISSGFFKYILFLYNHSYFFSERGRCVRYPSFLVNHASYIFLFNYKFFFKVIICYHPFFQHLQTISTIIVVTTSITHSFIIFSMNRWVFLHILCRLYTVQLSSL